MLLPSVPGRFSVSLNEVRFECFYHPSAHRRLYVLLSSAGRRVSYPRFDKFSWREALPGHCLYIEDPMYGLFPELTVGWYYGNQTASFLDDIVEIVRRAAAALRLSATDITFIGSSAGGYAALYSAATLVGASALAHNPQITLGDWPGRGEIERITGNDLLGQDRLRRNSIRWVAQASASRLFLTVNTASPIDFEMQISPWLEELDIPIAYPVTRCGSTSFIFHHTPGERAHHVFPKREHDLPLINAISIDQCLCEETTAAFIGNYTKAATAPCPSPGATV